MIESRFAISLRGHVTLHQARYRHAREEVGRVWIAVDGREIAAFATHMGWPRVRPLADAIMDERDAWGTSAAYAAATTDAEEQLLAAGEFSETTALEALEAALSMTLEATLVSSNPLLRALAMLDRRLGKRRLVGLVLPLDEHPLVRELYALRRRMDKIDISAPVV